MKKVIAWLLVLALTAAISIGATLAYLTDTDEDVNVMTLGKVKIDQLEYERVDVESKDKDATVQEFHDNKPLLPAVTDKDFKYTPGTSYVDWEQIGKDGYTSEIWDPAKINNEVDKMVFVKNKGDYDAFVRSVFAFEAGKYTTLDQFKQMVHLNLNETDYTWKWISTPVAIPNADGTETTNYFVAVATYHDALEPGALTEISLSQIALDKTATNEDVEAFGETYQVLVKTQGIQADGFTDADTALNEGFGTIAADNIPWENDNPTTGPDFWTLLHRYEGGTTDISSKVSKIVFGKPDVHAAAVAGYEPVKFEIGQDVPANVYYVENGNMYELYFLSSDVIYTPELCGWLFEELSNLVTLDTTNLDVSRTTSMLRMFTKCTSLTTVDFSHWDTSNVTEFSQMFWACTGLVTAQIGEWDTSNGVAFNSMFSYCSKLNLDKDELKGWDMSKAEKLNHMFYECLELEEIDLSGWNVTNVTTTSHMFCDCNSLASVKFDGWQTPNLISMDGMFNDCHSLTEVDMSSFDTSNCRELSQIFEACKNLETIKGLETWNTQNAGTFEQTFSGCTSLKELDLSSFNTRNVVNDYYPMLNGSTGWGFKQMFYNVTSLEKLTLGADFTFDGDGKVTTVSYKVSLPSPAAKEGYIAKWQNVETGEVYLASEIPEETAATYVAYYEYASKGAKMKDALHYLDANTSGTKITKKVTKVVFGLNKDYPDITSAYTGVLADQEQDVPVYAYYVPDGTNYHIYFLADSAIYAPKDCTDLFLDMSALKSVDTGNFDVSRTQIMYKMFRSCGSLTDIDVSNWNTSNVTSMRALFSGAKSLVSVDTTKWDTSNVVEMNNMFYDCFALKEIKGHENWNTSNVTSMVQMFLNCTSLPSVEVGNWDVSNVTRFKAMFASLTQNEGDMLFKELDVENWDMSSATDLEAMFYGCGQLTSLDLSKWNVQNVTQVAHMFTDCFKLESIDLSGWNTESLTCLDAMFNDCRALKVIDLSSFTTDKVKEFSQLFEACHSLETIIGLEDWDTSSGQDFSEMFNQCTSLKELDLSSFVTVQANKDYITYYPWENNMFLSFLSGCTSLEKITFGPSFSFDGDGSATGNFKFSMPAATNVEGWDGNWYDANGKPYAPANIPEETAATYYAVKPVTP